MPRVGGVLACAVILLLITGCIGASHPASTRTSVAPTTHPAEVNKEEGGGVLRGIVLDDEAVPIQGATVQVGNTADLSRSVTLSTNYSGMFRAEGLLPGSYLVLAQKAGYYESAPQRVTVTEGQATNVHFELRFKATTDPFHTTVSGRVQVDAHACVLIVIIPQCGTSVYNASISPKPFHYIVDEKKSGLLEDIIVEAIWTPTVSACTGAMTTYTFGAPYLEDQQYAFFFYDYDHVESPTRLHITRIGDEPNSLESKAAGKAYDPSGKWQVTPQTFWGFDHGTPVDVDCMAQQPVTSYATFFFGSAAAADWTIASDA